MPTDGKFLFLIVALTAVHGAPVARQAAPRQRSDGLNLARGVPCRFDPAPNYGYCRDDDDPKQLTDGLYNGCVWTDKGTVGWQPRRNAIAFVDLDLGKAGPIGKVTFDTITGAAQVTFPSAVLVFVSSDGKDYRLLCDVLTECLPQTELLNHRFVADGLKGWGRYVRLALIPGGFFVFCDEIEIMAGDHTQGEAEYMTDDAIPADRVREVAKSMIGWATQKNATLALLAEADRALGTRADALADAQMIADARRQLDDTRKQCLIDPAVAPANYGIGPPYRRHDRRAFQAIAKLNARLWPDRPFVLWQTSDWAWLRPLDAPLGQDTGAQVRVDMMQNEWATASFVVTSTSETPLELSLSAADFRGPATLAAGDVLRVAHVVHAEAFGFNYRDDPIVPATAGPIVLGPGVSKRIWLTFRTRGLSVAAGTYRSSVTVADNDGKATATVPVELRVWPLRFPDQVSLHSNSWGYFDDPCIQGHETEAARDLVEHYNTALTVNHRYLPKPKPDQEGNLTEPLDFTKLDQMLAWNPECRLWLIWVGFEFGFNRMGTPSFGTPAWERAFTQYVTQMRDHLASKGVTREGFAWYWTDEPGGEKWEQFDHPASVTLKKIDPEMLVWADPTRRVTPEQFEASLPYVDIYCPSLGTLENGAVLDICHRTRLTSWQYVCASEKNADPFGYYRWFAWKAWRNKLGGIGMWVYVDPNGQTFSDYVSGVSYAMAYKGEQGVIGSKRWDAWRQGIADYEYLRMLADAVTAARGAGGKSSALERAEKILGAGVDQVVGDSPHGGQPEDRDLPDRYRLEILECLSKLRRISRQAD